MPKTNIPVLKEIPVSKNKHPDPKYEMLPKHEFSMGFIAPKGAGKTTTIINLLEFYKDVFHTIVIFSPTVKLDEKWKYIKKKPLLVENLPLKKWVKQMKDKSKKYNPVVEGRDPKTEFDDLVEDRDPNFDGKIPEDCFIEDYTSKDLVAIYSQQQKLVKLLEKYGQTKHLANRILLIFDDLVGSHLFTNQKHDAFKGFNTRHRHYSCSILLVSQAYREIPKTIRTNLTCLILFEICSEAELEAISEEYPMDIKRTNHQTAKELWHQMYEYAVNEPYSFLFYNMQPKDKRKRCMKRFDEYLFFGE